jgi:hypothetical protein
MLFSKNAHAYQTRQLIKAVDDAARTQGILPRPEIDLFF